MKNIYPIRQERYLGTINIDPNEGIEEREVLSEFLRSPQFDTIMLSDPHAIYKRSPTYGVDRNVYEFITSRYHEFGPYTVTLLIEGEEKTMYSFNGIKWFKLKIKESSVYPKATQSYNDLTTVDFEDLPSLDLLNRINYPD